MTRIPYELIESLFGTRLADNFNTICACLCFVGIFMYFSNGSISTRRKSRKRKKSKDIEYGYINWSYDLKTKKWEGPIYTPEGQRKQSETGWTFNEETQLWEPPKSLQRESAQRWEWDEDKKIWIDKNKKDKP